MRTHGYIVYIRRISINPLIVFQTNNDATQNRIYFFFDKHTHTHRIHDN